MSVSVEGAPRPLAHAIDRAGARAVEYLLAATRPTAGDPTAVRLAFEAGRLGIAVEGPAGGEDAVAVALAAAGERLAAYGGGITRADAPPGRLVALGRLPLTSGHV